MRASRWNHPAEEQPRARLRRSAGGRGGACAEPCASHRAALARGLAEALPVWGSRRFALGAAKTIFHGATDITQKPGTTLR
jgi:hypothetical protein